MAGSDWWRMPMGAEVDPFAQGELPGPVHRNPAGTMFQTYRQPPLPPMRPIPQERPGAMRALPGAMLPMGDWSALARAMWEGLTAPRRAMQGELVTNADVAGTALDAMGGGAVRGIVPSKTMASRRASMYTLPTKAETPNGLGELYPGGMDLEGRPLVARHVVGRAAGRKGEQSLSPEAVAEVIQATTGRGPEGVPASALPSGAVGSANVNRATRRPTGVQFYDKLKPSQVENVVRHELGHVIDELAGQIPVDGILRDLESLYSYGIEGRVRSGAGRSLPKHHGYTKSEQPRELVAEALRQYTSAPDSIKMRFPKVAARLRQYVNEHPEISRFVALNSLAGVAATMPFMGEDR